MTHSTSDTGARSPDGEPRHHGEGTDGPTHRPIDWIAAEKSPEFRELIQKRRSFVLPATIFFLAWYLGFIVLAGYARDFMGTELFGGVTVGYLLALTQFIMVWVLGAMYIRRADRIYDPLARKAAERARTVRGEAGEAGDGGVRGEPGVAR